MRPRELEAMESVTLYKFEAGWGLPSFSPECVALEAYLRLSGIRFAEERVTSANSSPTGRLPALDIDGLAVGSWEDGEGSNDGEAASVSRVLDGLRKAGVDLDKGLSVEDACDLEAYLSLAENALAVATQWALWCDDQSYAEGTRVSLGTPPPNFRVRDRASDVAGADHSLDAHCPQLEPETTRSSTLGSTPSPLATSSPGGRGGRPWLR